MDRRPDGSPRPDRPQDPQSQQPARLASGGECDCLQDHVPPSYVGGRHRDQAIGRCKPKSPRRRLPLWSHACGDNRVHCTLSRCRSAGLIHWRSPALQVRELEHQRPCPRRKMPPVGHPLSAPVCDRLTTVGDGATYSCPQTKLSCKPKSFGPVKCPAEVRAEIIGPLCGTRIMKADQISLATRAAAPKA